jgi:hypothetical protein
MKSEDWYRNEVWSPDIERNFHSKLSNARSQRDQYLKIQILCLTERHPHAALGLGKFYFETRSDCSWDLDVKHATAKAHEQLKDFDAASEAYREILKHECDKPFFPFMALLDAPYLIARKTLKSEFSFALETLTRAELEFSKRGITHVVEQFILHASHAIIRNHSKQKPEARDHAVVALKLAGVKDSGLRYHRKVGLVGPEYQKTILTLKSITSGYPRIFLELAAKFG